MATMSNVQGVRCETCGKVGETHYAMSTPPGWYTVYHAVSGGMIPQDKGPYHFDTRECMAHWLNTPVLIKASRPLPLWRRLLSI